MPLLWNSDFITEAEDDSFAPFWQILQYLNFRGLYCEQSPRSSQSCSAPNRPLDIEREYEASLPIACIRLSYWDVLELSATDFN